MLRASRLHFKSFAHRLTGKAKTIKLGEENVATFGMKIFGFTLIIIGGLILLSAKV